VDAQQRLLGVVTRVDLQRLVDSAPGDAAAQIHAMMRTTPTVTYPDEPLRVVVYRMAETGLTRFPVVERGPVPRLVGMIALDDLLKARTLNLEAERRRERVISVRFAFPFAFRAAAAGGSVPPQEAPEEQLRQ
jgi:CBS domain-containing protein